eukprot:5713734-Prymnesium_polylepis.2
MALFLCHHTSLRNACGICPPDVLLVPLMLRVITNTAARDQQIRVGRTSTATSRPTARRAPMAVLAPCNRTCRCVGARCVGARRVGARRVGAQRVGARCVGARRVRGSTARGSTARGSTACGSTACGSTVRGSSAHGSTARGSTAHGSTACGSTARGSTARGSMHGAWEHARRVGAQCVLSLIHISEPTRRS